MGPTPYRPPYNLWEGEPLWVPHHIEPPRTAMGSPYGSPPIQTSHLIAMGRPYGSPPFCKPPILDSPPLYSPLSPQVGSPRSPPR